VLLAVAPDRQFQPFRQRVHHGHADAVQAARNLVGVIFRSVFELSARVELGHDHFGGGNAFAGMDASGNAASVVFHRHRPVGVQFDEHQIAMAGQSLVDRVVGNLEHHVVQARSVIGIADIHARALAHGVQSFEDLDRIGAVGIGVLAALGRGFVSACHAQHIGTEGAGRNPFRTLPSTRKSCSQLTDRGGAGHIGQAAILSRPFEGPAAYPRGRMSAASMPSENGSSPGENDGYIQLQALHAADAKRAALASRPCQCLRVLSETLAITPG